MELLKFAPSRGAAVLTPLRVNLPRAVPPGSLGAIVRSFKAAVTKRVHDKFQVSGPVWQRNYFERVVRDGEEFSNATRYIKENPARWEWIRRILTESRCLLSAHQLSSK